jgi:hypothetical protein
MRAATEESYAALWGLVPHANMVPPLPRGATLFRPYRDWNAVHDEFEG